MTEPNENGQSPVEGAERVEKQELPAAEPVVIKIAGGEDVTLKSNDLAVLVILDPYTGTPAVFNVQNCPLRAFSRMLLNEALNLYALVSHANYTTSILEQRMLASLKKADKKGFVNPFDKK